ncbi:MAG: DUF444 family protein [bacterium]|nr:DUF444 family protein [bacterium]
MAVKKQDWDLSQRGRQDAARHRDKVRESIRKNLADIISDTSIITRKKGQVVKVPIRGLKSYQFINKRPGSGGSGIGQGEGEEGDVIGRRPDKDGQPGQAGDQPGVDYLETEIDLEELIEMMLADLGLPNLQDKAIRETMIPKGWKFDSREKHGIQVHLDKKRSVMEAIKRTAGFVGELMRSTGRSEEDCRQALAGASGDLIKAKEMLLAGQVLAEGQAAVHLYNDDLRFRTMTEDIEYQSNAVVFAMMDVSGSMDTMKKYLARSFFFWLVEFLKQIYNNVQIRFIAHTTEADIVEEHEFFHKGQSGGTFCHTAFDKAIELVESRYAPDKWNIYPFYFSDGEDFDTVKTLTSAKKLMRLGVNMLGYGEIQTSQYGSSYLMDNFLAELNVDGQEDGDGFEAYYGLDSLTPFVGVVLKDKSHVYPALKAFLKKEMTFGGGR